MYLSVLLCVYLLDEAHGKKKAILIIVLYAKQPFLQARTATES
jgi:hypothetical protein